MTKVDCPNCGEKVPVEMSFCGKCGTKMKTGEVKENYTIKINPRENDINEEVLSKTYKNELSYFTLSSKCILNGRYIEALYFADKAKQIFIKEENAKRYLDDNKTFINLVREESRRHKFFDEIKNINYKFKYLFFLKICIIKFYSQLFFKFRICSHKNFYNCIL